MFEPAYPKHVYDPVRYRIARDLLQKELRKLFPHAPDQAWMYIDKAIGAWAEHPNQYHLENPTYRDFWDIFAAVIESIKLKGSFARLLTAENYTWDRQKLPLIELCMSSPLGQLHKIPGLNVRHDTPLREVKSALEAHPESLAEQRALNDNHSRDPEQDNYPVIIKINGRGECLILDGNRRCLRALLYDKNTMDAWVVTTNGEPPRNHWVPVNDLMQLVALYKDAKKSGLNAAVPAIRQTLETYFTMSEIARINYDRAQTEHWGQQLLAEPLPKTAT